MKNIIYLFLLVFITTTTGILKSQEITPLDFFPYHVGDIWQYIEYPSGIFQSGGITRIDTIDTNTHLVFYENNEIPSIKVILDSAIIFADSASWFPWYKLMYPVGAIWVRDTTTSWWVHFKTQYIAEVFDENKDVREYHIYEFIPPGDTNGLPGQVDYLVKGIGRYRITWEGGEKVLSGCIINGVQYGTIVSVENGNDNLQPSKYVLDNFPNPFNGQTTIHYFIPSASRIAIGIYDILGNEIEKIFEGEKIAGHHYQTWEPKNESSGLYFVVMKTSKSQLIHKVLLLK